MGGKNQRSSHVNLPVANVSVTNTPTSGAKLRIATYNVHGCMGMDRQRSEARIADVIAEMSVDVVALQEVDRGRRRSASADQTKMIAEQLGWYSHFHPAMRKDDEHYGNAILSRYQLDFRRAVDLPGRPPFFCRENRAAIEVNVETNLGKVHIINTHLGLGWRERFVQAQLFTSAEWRAAIAADTPLILVGDFNSLRGSRPYRTLNRHLRDVRDLIPATRPTPTFPTRLPLLAVDHIFVNQAIRPLSVTVHRSPLARTASDHFPLMAEFVLSLTVASNGRARSF
jgi:endonuclease/exonuclease/phosphatase family metal-dependent hydrolase